jgi:hypothetical protein
VADAISDAALVTVLRPFVRATRPVLAGLRDADPFGLRNRVASEEEDRSIGTTILDALASVEVPGTSAWAAMDVTERSDWWVYRVGRLTTLLAAVPGIGGALANRLPVSKILGAAGQGLVLVAIAGEHGVQDEEALVGLLGKILFRRDLVIGKPDAAADAAAEKQAAELTGDLDEPTVTRIGKAVWRLGRALLAAEGELDRRPHGNILHEGLGMLPVVGAVGKYLGEWSGLKKAARQAEERLRHP